MNTAFEMVVIANQIGQVLHHPIALFLTQLQLKCHVYIAHRQSIYCGIGQALKYKGYTFGYTISKRQLYLLNKQSKTVVVDLSFGNKNNSAANTIIYTKPQKHLYPVKLVGAGAGDPEQLTIKAYKAIQQADIVFYDSLISDDILRLIPPNSIAVHVGKRAGQHSFTQPEINHMLVCAAQCGLKVVRLKAGDPFIFGRAAEELLELHQHGLTFEVIAGITAASAASAQYYIPLTHRDLARSVRYLTGYIGKTEHNFDWIGAYNPNETTVVYMGLKNIKALSLYLLQNQYPESLPVLLVQNASRKNSVSQFGTLNQLITLSQQLDTAQPTILMLGSALQVQQQLVRLPCIPTQMWDDIA